MSDRYTQDDERRAGVDEAAAERAAQSNAGQAGRDQDDPAGADTVSGKTERESAAGGHGHGGAIDMALDKEPAEGRRDVSTD